MIVRILGEGQLDVPDAALDGLNELDSRLEAAVDSDDQVAFGPALAALLDGVRAAGVPHPGDSLATSDLILPPGDATVAEVRAMLADDGLIPG